MSNVLPFPGANRSPEPSIEAIRERDAEAITQAYHLHHRAVRGFARRMLSDEIAAEDVVHDVFVALPDAAVGFRGDSSLGTFLVGIAVNLCRRRLRSRRRARSAVERMAASTVTPPVETPEAIARGRELARALREALDELSVEQREVFVLCAIEERTSRQAAEIVGAPEGTVRTRLMAARRSLKRRLRGRDE